MELGSEYPSTQLSLACPEAKVVGLGGDPKILAIAGSKARTAGADIELREGLAYELPFANASFDRVVSSLVFRHLSMADKTRALAEVCRILRPEGGQCLIADFGKSQNALMGRESSAIRALDGAETMRVNLQGRLPALMSNAGLVDVRRRIASDDAVRDALVVPRHTVPTEHVKV